MTQTSVSGIIDGDNVSMGSTSHNTSIYSGFGGLKFGQNKKKYLQNFGDEDQNTEIDNSEYEYLCYRAIKRVMDN